MKSEPRDPFNVFLLWIGIAAVTALAVVTAIAAPLVYCWIMGLMTCFVIGLGTVLMVGCMEPITAIFWGGEVIKAAFYVIGAILAGLADASK